MICSAHGVFDFSCHLCEAEKDPGFVARKGEKGENCNVRSCQKPGAFYYNKSTRKYYCTSCALLINSANRQDSMELYGTPDLCEREKQNALE